MEATRVDSLRQLLKQPNCGERVVELLTDQRLAELFIPHVREVFRRMDVVIEPYGEELWFLKLAVLVHEVPLTQLPDLLNQIGFGDVQGPVLEIVGGFGEIWKTAPEAISTYVCSHHQHLRGLLMFELAHEGQATTAMAVAAGLGGLGDDFERYTRILHYL